MQRGHSFNPLPRRATRETDFEREDEADGVVSIHSRVVRRGRQRKVELVETAHVVSIHSRVVRRGRPADTTALQSASAFQSTPASCDAGDRRSGWRTANAWVSIHSRVVRRGRPNDAQHVAGRPKFQSTPASCDAGDTVRGGLVGARACRFNPLPRRATRETPC